MNALELQILTATSRVYLQSADRMPHSDRRPMTPHEQIIANLRAAARWLELAIVLQLVALLITIVKLMK